MKTLAKLRSDPRVADAYRDNDGYWADLKPGFVRGCDEVHSVHEWNVRDLLRGIREVVPCACEGCLRGIARMAASRDERALRELENDEYRARLAANVEAALAALHD